jgi:hypothetical protein
VSGQLSCAAEGCDRPVVRRPGALGRPPIRVEIDKDDDSEIEHGREWTVRLRRGEQVLVVRSGLGRFSATVFATELSSLVNPRRDRS